jgi:RNA polymerase sigma-70 factor, ECF subfamily
MESKEEKFRKTVGEHKKKILSICRYYAPTVEDQKDMYQEILINIWRSLETFRGDSEIGTWIYRIGVNTSLSYAGKHYKRMKLNVDIENQNLKHIVTDEEDDPALQEERLQMLQDKLNQLNVIDKAIIGLLLEDLSTKEISDIIGITEPNVRVKIHRIKENLRNQMKGGNHE